MKKYIVKLTKRERADLTDLVKKGKGAARKLSHARVLLKVDSGKYGEHYTDEEAKEALSMGLRTIERIRERFVEEGLEAALIRREHRGKKPRLLDGAQEAKLVSLACSQAPEGRTRWTLQLLADKMVELKCVDSVSRWTVQRTLKKMK